MGSLMFLPSSPKVSKLDGPPRISKLTGKNTGNIRYYGANATRILNGVPHIHLKFWPRHGSVSITGASIQWDMSPDPPGLEDQAQP
jgi:hypothetical protein